MSGVKFVTLRLLPGEVRRLKVRARRQRLSLQEYGRQVLTREFREEAPTDPAAESVTR